MGRAHVEFEKHGQKMVEARQRFLREQDIQQLGWRVVEQVLDQIPLCPSFIHPHTAYPNTPAHLAFKLETVEEVREWRRVTAVLLDAFPACPLFRFKDFALSFTPELTEKQELSLEDDRKGYIGQMGQVAPFIVKLDRYGGSPSSAVVTWFHKTNPASTAMLPNRVQVTVEVGSYAVGTEPVGMHMEPVYESTGKGGGQRLVDYRPVFPFPTYRVDRFWSQLPAAKPAVAYWDLSCLPAECCGGGPYNLVRHGLAFMRLTEPPGGAS